MEIETSNLVGRFRVACANPDGQISGIFVQVEQVNTVLLALEDTGNKF